MQKPIVNWTSNPIRLFGKSYVFPVTYQPYKKGPDPKYFFTIFFFNKIMFQSPLFKGKNVFLVGVFDLVFRGLTIIKYIPWKHSHKRTLKGFLALSNSVVQVLVHFSIMFIYKIKKINKKNFFPDPPTLFLGDYLLSETYNFLFGMLDLTALEITIWCWSEPTCPCCNEYTCLSAKFYCSEIKLIYRTVLRMYYW